MDTVSLLRFFLAFAFVMTMMGGLALVLKYISQNRGLKCNTEKRINLVETMTLDAKRRAIILECDGKEHLVILGLSGETVVDTLKTESKKKGKA